MGSVGDNFKVWDNIDQHLKSSILAKINSTIECSVCSEILHVPFVLACGHSFCYDCLTAWFENKLNCPTCRHDLEQQPVLNIQLKEISKNITDLIIESTSEPKEKEKLIKQRDESLKNYNYDHKHKRLFGDSFKSSLTLIDRSDGVPRCGNCHWEAHGSVCLHCGTRFRIPRDDGYYDSEDGDAYNEDDEEIMLYGRDNGDHYDSEDSFVDTRDLNAINQDLIDDERDILSSASSASSVEELEWHGFDNDSASIDDVNSIEDYGTADLQRALDEFHEQNLQDSDNESDESIGRRRRSRVVTIIDSDEDDD